MNTQKTYYSIREVCTKTGLEPHVLRYWESEFSLLRPKKNRAGNRAYREKDIETIGRIKFLLYDEQYTIQGAKKKLNQGKSKPEMNENQIDPMKETVQELRDILKVLDKGR